MSELTRVAVLILVIIALVLISGCASAPSQLPQPGNGGQDEGAIPGEPTQDRKIVKQGSISLEVQDISETMDRIADMAEELNGYVVSSYKSEYESRVWGRIVIRVPAEEFDVALARARQLALAVPYETTEAKDVTEEYVDLEAQLSNLRATEVQYLALLEKAGTVEEILKVQKELSNVRGQIEQIQGRMQYLEHTSEMALIDVTLREAKGLVEPWSGSAVVRSAVRGLIAFGRGLATVLIWLGIFCWVWVPPLVIWLRRRRRART